MPRRLRSVKGKPRIKRMCFECGEHMYTTAQVVERWIYGYTIPEIVKSLSNLGYERVFQEDIEAILRIKRVDDKDTETGKKDHPLRTFKSWASIYNFKPPTDMTSSPVSDDLPATTARGMKTDANGEEDCWREFVSNTEPYDQDSPTSTVFQRSRSQSSGSSTQGPDSTSRPITEDARSDTYDDEEDRWMVDEFPVPSHQRPGASTQAAINGANPIAEYVGMLRYNAHPSTHTLNPKPSFSPETTHQPDTGNYDHCSSQCDCTYTTKQVVELWLLGFTVPEIWVQLQILGFNNVWTDTIRWQLRSVGYDLSVRSEDGDPFQRFVEGRGVNMGKGGMSFGAKSGRAKSGNGMEAVGRR